MIKFLLCRSSGTTDLEFDTLEDAENNINFGKIIKKQTYIETDTEKRTVYVCKNGSAIIISYEAPSN